MFLNGGNTRFYRKSIAFTLAMIFSFSSIIAPVQAQSMPFMPSPGTIVRKSQPNDPIILQGLKVYPDDPFKLDFIVDPGQVQVSDDAFKTSSSRFVRYFLTALTIPSDDLWVNLSPFEKDRVVTDAFGQTEMGRDLLAQDYLLKQLTASMIHPDAAIGQSFWKKVYAEAYRLYGTTDIPVDTFNKVWVVPGQAGVYENGDKALVVESSLKVMLETDYKALEAEKGISSGNAPDPGRTTNLDAQIMREVVIPEIQREINEGENFASLRQVYNALILAKWYKTKLKSAVFQKYYIDQRKVLGINIEDKQASEKIFEQYVQAFSKGVYSLIREETDPYSQELIPRKYFSGGCDFTGQDFAMSIYGNAGQYYNRGREKLGRFFSRAKASGAILLSVLLLPMLSNQALSASPAIPIKISTPITEQFDALKNIQMNIDLLTTKEKDPQSAIMQMLHTLQVNNNDLSRDVLSKAIDVLLNYREMIQKDKNLITQTLRALIISQYHDDSTISARARNILYFLNTYYPDQIKQLQSEFAIKRAEFTGITRSGEISIPKAVLQDIFKSGQISGPEVDKYSGLATLLRDYPSSIKAAMSINPDLENVTVLEILRNIPGISWRPSAEPGSVEAYRSNEGPPVWSYRYRLSIENPMTASKDVSAVLALAATLLALIDTLPKRPLKLDSTSIIQPIDHLDDTLRVSNNAAIADPVLSGIKALRSLPKFKIYNLADKDLRIIVKKVWDDQDVSPVERLRIEKYLKYRNAAIKGLENRRQKQIQAMPSLPISNEKRRYNQLADEFSNQLDSSYLSSFIWGLMRSFDTLYAKGKNLFGEDDSDQGVNFDTLRLNDYIYKMMAFKMRYSAQSESFIYSEHAQPWWNFKVDTEKKSITIQTPEGNARLYLDQILSNDQAKSKGSRKSRAIIDKILKYSSTEMGRENYERDYEFADKPEKGKTRENMVALLISELIASELEMAPISNDNVGGIDLNDNLLTIALSGQGAEIKLKPEALSTLGDSLEGFKPEILSIAMVDAEEYFNLPPAK